MKKVTLTAVFLSFFILTFAQWQTDGNNIYFNTGNVGIGSDNPYDPLTIKTYDGEDIFEFNSYYESLYNYYPQMNMRNNHLSAYCGILLLPRINNEPTFEFGFSNDQGTPRNFTFRANGEQLFTIRGVGNVGVGTSMPNSKLEVSEGDIYISDIGSGIIMKSPNGKCWKYTPDNNGNLIGENIDCPTASTVISELTNSTDKINIYPNPTSNIVNIEFLEIVNFPVEVRFFDILGKLVYSSTIETKKTSIDIKKLLKGTYIMNIDNLNGLTIKTEKIIKE